MARTSDLSGRLRAMIVERGYGHNAQLPPERELSATLGVTRNQLRRPLDALEAAGLVWRHVGRGTFVGARPVLNIAETEYLRSITTPAQVIEARLAIEPNLASLAALHATDAQIERIGGRIDECIAAADWRGYEAADNSLHLEIARATQNKLLVFLFETLNTVRRTVVWSQRRATQRPPRDYASFREHRIILDAITAGEAGLAAEAMRVHLTAVYERVLPMLKP
ncbi:FCD domain-containing protein [uncultured Jannaschia sp.]|uniref:FadR/GntR family transcriptional regulator n=1 Tax=uncultured Jannaschia sp. TaxID=293347 RepID=UPI002620C12B|nr:FCD domain-containing protein [uncultured Jannaschia sp.]